MNNFMKLFSIFVLFIQIQIALSQPNLSPPGPNLIQQLCKSNRYQTLCVSTLNLDPRSKTSDIQGLASISIDATTKKVNESLDYLTSVYKKINGGGRGDYERYGTCMEEYGAAANRFLPAALADLKAKKYSLAMSDMKEVVSVPGICEDQFAGYSPLPVTQRNKAVHDIADMTADIIKTFVK
ncbi:unnamed protein product [Eruca vesicaria subsp. sativa]|uniref:Pectinesterase inhibitor domain-containing protein n=1 Tax=Eruca vesicaria subsp. sativa TaxID=29727 RepID=A0ABC8L993_ERUVS|nr:unnamed protein product [Eruca vesicaria subsp. sativa]